MEAYNEDMQYKKKLANASKHKKGACGYKNKSWVNFGMPKGYMTRKEQELLGGEVLVYNLNDPIREVKTYEEVKKMEYEEGKSYLLELRDRFTVTELAKHWGVTASTLYGTIFKKFDINKKNLKKKKTAKKIKKENKPVDVKEEIKVEEQSKYEVTAKAGFSVSLKGEFTAAELMRKITAISSLVEGDENSDTRYSVDISLVETIEK
jgi:hypothetical protein